MEISVKRIGKQQMSIQVHDVFQRIGPQGLLITPDEAEHLLDALSRELGHGR